MKWLFGVYGAERDRWIANSRMVLNLHAHDGQILELPRLAYLWANRVPVVAERNAQTEDSLGLTSFMMTARYDDLVDRVVDALASPSEVKRTTQACYEAFREGPSMAQILQEAFAHSVEEVPGA